MKTARFLGEDQYAGLKAAMRDLARRTSGAGRDRRGVTRVSHQQLSDYGSTNERFAEVFAPIDVVADLEADCEDPIVSRALAELAGCLLVRKPEAARRPPTDVDAACHSAKESAEATSAFWAAKSDGKLTADEVTHVREQIRETVVAFLEFDALLAAQAGGE